MSLYTLKELNNKPAEIINALILAYTRGTRGLQDNSHRTV